MSVDGYLCSQKPRGNWKRYVLLKILGIGQEGSGCHTAPNSRPRGRRRFAKAAFFSTQGPADKRRLEGTDLGP